MYYNFPEHCYIFYYRGSETRAFVDHDTQFVVSESGKQIDHDAQFNIVETGVAVDHQTLFSVREEDEMTN